MIHHSATKEMSADERREVFADQFNQDSDVDAAYTLARLVQCAGDYLSHIVGKESADAGMATMLRPLIGTEPHANWREGLAEHDGECCATWPLGEVLTTLTAYAYFGVLFPRAPHEPEASNEERLKQLIAHATAFFDNSPLELWISNRQKKEPLVRLILLVRNRWALDNGQPIEPAALAYFGGVTEARIRNLTTGPDARFTILDNKTIPAPQALAWLADRDTYLDSVWREQSVATDAPARDVFEGPMFVPVARDGSIFHPGLARQNGFTVGPKGEERQISDFQEALFELQRMPIPYWRRPNEKKKYGIVRGVQWERHDMNSLSLRS